MKKNVVLLALAGVFILSASAAFAGGRNLNVNQSAEYCKTLNRVATNDTDADMAYFNPAGTALVPDGLYLYLSNQFVVQPIQITPAGGHWNELAGIKDEYKGKKYGYLFPDLYLNYKKDWFAWSIGLIGIGGGGSAEYPNGLQQIDASLKFLGPMINSLYTSMGLGAPFGPMVISKFSGSSAVYGGQTSVAFSLLKEKLALSVGYRFEYGDSEYKGKIYSPGGAYGGYIPLGSEFHATQKGMAHGIILGVSTRPVDNLVLALRGEWMSQMRLKTNSTNWLIVGMSDSSMRDGMSKANQSPANLSAGIAYKINGLQIAGSFVYCFNQFAQWNGKEKGYTGGYDLGIGLDYTFKAVPLNIGVGYLYNESGARPSGRDQMWEELDANNVSAGLSYSFLNNTLKLTVAELVSIYTPMDVNKGTMLKFLPARVHKMSYDTTIGISYKAI